LKNIHDGDYEAELNSKYDPRPKTVNLQKKMQNPERRLIKTAKIHRQKLQTSEMNEELSNTQKQSTGSTPSSFTKSISIKNPTIINQGFIKGNSMKSTTLRSNSSKENISINHDYPMRLKDYEANFQAYKLISGLIDQQMKW
jgi:hypothetical protein